MPDWYRDHNLSPEAYSDAEYADWAQGNGLYVDAAGNVDYGPPDVETVEMFGTHETEGGYLLGTEGEAPSFRWELGDDE